MKRVTIEIDRDRCVGCRLCVLACPTDCYDFDEGKNIPVVVSTRDCLVCYSCKEQCALSAIEVSLF